MNRKWPESGGFWKCWRSKNRRRRTKLRRRPSKVKVEGDRTRRFRDDTFQHLPARSFPESVTSLIISRERDKGLEFRLCFSSRASVLLLFIHAEWHVQNVPVLLLFYAFKTILDKVPRILKFTNETHNV